MTYLDSISLSHTLPCLAEPGKVIVVGTPDRPLGDIIPYLATLPSVIAYNPDTKTLTFRRKSGFLTIYPDKIYITQVADASAGLVALEVLKDAINATWEHRSELAAVKTRKQAMRHLDVYSMLPQTNCKQCGEAACLAFAVQLILQNRMLDECLPMQQDIAFADRKAALEAMLS